jgi:hypothetical protein
MPSIEISFAKLAADCHEMKVSSITKVMAMVGLLPHQEAGRFNQYSIKQYKGSQGHQEGVSIPGARDGQGTRPRTTSSFAGHK